MSHTETHTHNEQLTLGGQIKNIIGKPVSRCYQCGKCSAGCPLAEEMDYTPNTILRMLQADTPELEDKILRSLSIWLCLTCETCVTRCPMEMDLPKVMDFLRSESMKQDKVNPKAKDILAFHQSFLNSIQSNGRLYEMGLVMDYKMKTKHFLQDMSVAPTMYMKGKLGLTPHLIKGKEALKRIFERTKIR